jgi:hypothetical protein
MGTHHATRRHLGASGRGAVRALVHAEGFFWRYRNQIGLRRFVTRG